MIYYLGYYSCEQIADEHRNAAPPAINKMNYVISALSTIVPNNFMVVSPSGTNKKKTVRGNNWNINQKCILKTFDSFSSDKKIIRFLGYFYTKFQVLYYLLSNIHSDDILIVYHSLSLMKMVQLVKNIKKCRLILEVEEVYSDVKENEKLRKKELKFINIADKYLMITDLLNKEINTAGKPSVISHGTYLTVPHYSDKMSDGKIHVVYAGSFNPIKGGVYAAIEAAEFLDDRYLVHILGKGSKAETDAVITKIENVALKTKCHISYEGFKTGREFDSFIQSCHIGLSTQQPNGKYNASSFPSKVLMYMSNGLPVVSIRIPAVEQSNVGEYVYFYNEPNPQKIAETIRLVPSTNYINACEKLNELDIAFKKELLTLLLDGE